MYTDISTILGMSSGVVRLRSPRIDVSEGGSEAMAGEVAVLGAPSAIGLVPREDGEPRRLDLAPQALRDQGLVARLRARDLGDVAPPQPYRDLERPAGRIRNEGDLVAYSRALADRIARCRRARQFVLLLGGDCSIVLGALLGLRAVDPASPGLVYIDAHADFATLDESPSASACSMALALAVGREERPLARLRDEGPLVPGEGVAHVGRRDHAATTYGDEALAPCGVLDLSMSELAARGVTRIAEEAVARGVGTGHGFWVHFDVDVLDPAAMPATGDLAPGGIDLAQAGELLETVLGDPTALGMQLTLYDPTLDADGAAAADLVALLERALAARR
jgi:arginase